MKGIMAIYGANVVVHIISNKLQIYQVFNQGCGYYLLQLHSTHIFGPLHMSNKIQDG